MGGDVALTTGLFWRVTLFTALLDAPLLALAGILIKPELFRRLKWYLAVVAFLVFGLIWLSVGSIIFWDEVYSQIFPAWTRWLLGPWFGLVEAALALGFWYLARLVKRGQAVIFVLSGGVMSLAGHAIGFSRGLMRVPMLADASPLAALVFGVFEFIFYWCAIVGIAVVGRWIALPVKSKSLES